MPLQHNLSQFIEMNANLFDQLRELEELRALIDKAETSAKQRKLERRVKEPRRSKSENTPIAN